MLAKREVEELINAIRDGVKAANGAFPAEGITVTVSVRNSEEEGALDTASFQVVVTEQVDRAEVQQELRKQLRDQIAALAEMKAEVIELKKAAADQSAAVAQGGDVGRATSVEVETAFDRHRSARRRRDERLRGSGRTTAGILQAIADAIFAPGRWVEFQDHASIATPGLAAAVSRMATQLNLRIAVVYTRRADDNSPHVLLQSNPLFRVRVQQGRVLRVADPGGRIQNHSVVLICSRMSPAVSHSGRAS